jgi:hypothetical protein
MGETGPRGPSPQPSPSGHYRVFLGVGGWLAGARTHSPSSMPFSASKRLSTPSAIGTDKALMTTTEPYTFRGGPLGLMQNTPQQKPHVIHRSKAVPLHSPPLHPFTPPPRSSPEQHGVGRESVHESLEVEREGLEVIQRKDLILQQLTGTDT